jgi:hypothetical protein
MTKNTDTSADNRQYAPFTHSFRDPWKDDDVEFSFRCATPTQPQIKRLSDMATKKSLQASRDLILATVHPEEKDELLSKLEEYPGIAISFSTAIIKTVGISSDLGN